MKTDSLKVLNISGPDLDGINQHAKVNEGSVRCSRDLNELYLSDRAYRLIGMKMVS